MQKKSSKNPSILLTPFLRSFFSYSSKFYPLVLSELLICMINSIDDYKSFLFYSLKYSLILKNKPLSCYNGLTYKAIFESSEKILLYPTLIKISVSQINHPKSEKTKFYD